MKIQQILPHFFFLSQEHVPHSLELPLVMYLGFLSDSVDSLHVISLPIIVCSGKKKAIFTLFAMLNVDVTVPFLFKISHSFHDV